MAKKKATKSKVPAWVPKDRSHVIKAIEELGDTQRELGVIETLMNDEIARIQSKYAEIAAPVVERKSTLTHGIAAWANAHRNELTDNGNVKFHDFGSGSVFWRLTPWSVTLRGVDEVIKKLKSMRLRKYVRTKEDVNKQALLEDRVKMTGKVEGITFHQSEEFIIAPAGLTVEKGQ